MMRFRVASTQTGMALVTSMLLLVILTILALSMFRSVGTEERIAGNTREKERALHAANSAQSYAEWWLLQDGNTAAGPVSCASGLIASPTQGQICAQTPQSEFGKTTAMVSAPNFPWLATAVSYAPPGMTFGDVPSTDFSNPPYFANPGFWITDVGVSGDGAGEMYQVDAYGYGGAPTTVAVVESVFEVKTGLVNRGGL